MAKKGFGVLCLGRSAEIMTKWRDLFGVSSSCVSETYLQWCRMEWHRGIDVILTHIVTHVSFISTYICLKHCQHFMSFPNRDQEIFAHEESWSMCCLIARSSWWACPDYLHCSFDPLLSAGADIKIRPLSHSGAVRPPYVIFETTFPSTNRTKK